VGAADDLDGGLPEIEISEDEAAGDATIPSAPPLPGDDDARDGWLVMRLGTLAASRPALRPARVGVAVWDITTGRMLYGKDVDGAYNLASNTKVLTSSVALARLGPDFRWRTSIYVDKWNPRTGTVEGDVYLRGHGDPTLRSDDLRALVHELAIAGVRAITGQIVVDTSYFDDVTEPPHYDEQPKERAGFRAPIGALSVDYDAITVVVEPDPAGGAARVRLEPFVGDYVVLRRAEVSTTSIGRSRIYVGSTVKKDHLELSVTGQLRSDGGADWTRRRIDDPVRFAGEVVRDALSTWDIRLGKKKIKTGVVPAKARLMASHDSAPLGEVVRDMNKTSNNFIAETLLKTIGAEAVAAATPPDQVPRPATWADGQAEVRRWLAEEAGLDPATFRVDNGSGLFGSTAVSPAQMVRALDAAWRDFRVGPDLAGSLAVMGVDGTLRSRLTQGEARGRVRAKTGTLAQVSTLSGYVAVDSRRPLAFSVLINDIPSGGRGHARALQNDIVAACVEYLGR
ncbi:MAG: D-alanyl-D-alanine carboxypeptidase/D-alanyl-D-alanine-endopeptidase, partial [Myxococcales bacterium]|nr:D-alanyl-D-alanine carboxypeptidase/D-alanyl-D-alanine-endopeptidase [Myxococcales bacterium]